MTISARKDLVVLTADKDQRLGISALLDRPDDLGFRAITFECFAHPKHDSGVYTSADNFLRPFLAQYDHALVVFDVEGCGQEPLGRAAVEQRVTERLAVNGWQDRCAAVAIDPELECWVWDRSLQVSRILKWQKDALKSWLLQGEFIATATTVKPARPKEAFLEAMKAANQKKSSAVFQDLARFAVVTSCTDMAFQKLLLTLRSWFPGRSDA